MQFHYNPLVRKLEILNLNFETKPNISINLNKIKFYRIVEAMIYSAVPNNT